MLNIAVLVSGGGTNLQAIIDAVKSGKITGGRVATVVSSNPNAYALERAKANGIETAVISKKNYENLEEYDKALVKYMREKNIDLIVLAGFLSIVGETLVKEFPNRIINVHPSLIPSFCGKGFYGLTVHEKALEYGVKVTGATVHFVNEIVDGGQIILQKAVYVEPDDTPEILQKRVMEQAEWEILPKAIDMICNGEI